MENDQDQVQEKEKSFAMLTVEPDIKDKLQQYCEANGEMTMKYVASRILESWLDMKLAEPPVLFGFEGGPISLIGPQNRDMGGPQHE